jgi:arginyl-tRNA synthetase
MMHMFLLRRLKMEKEIQEHISEVCEMLSKKEGWPAPPVAMISYPKEKRFGDYSTNVAFLWGKAMRTSPREVAQRVAGDISHPEIEKVQVEGPGFINLTMRPSWWQKGLKEILEKGEDYGSSSIGREEKVQVEFVSANPTGPLHIGHARGAAVGDTLARVLEKAGYQVEREYYVNDGGLQMKILGASLLARCKEAAGEQVEFPEDGYKGDYIVDLAKRALREMPEILEIPEEEAAARLSRWGAEEILKGIREDLELFNVSFHNWFSEASLYESGAVEEAVKELEEKGLIYENEDALWFASSRFGDDKDRVVRRSGGAYTYLAADIAYHRNKAERGFSQLVDVWGADHHGYIPRIKAALEALGYDPEMLKVLLIQLVNLLRQGKPVAMTTRGGQFVTLREVVDEVGKDAVRFMLLTRKCDAHLDFDLELAKEQSEENPVFYVQYAHARICSIRRTAQERGMTIPTQWKGVNLSPLTLEEEKELIKKLTAFTGVIEGAARSLEPHRITYYLQELAALFHGYYNRNRVLLDDEELRNARLAISEGVAIVLREGLKLLGVSAPTSM